MDEIPKFEMTEEQKRRYAECVAEEEDEDLEEGEITSGDEDEEEEDTHLDEGKGATEDQVEKEEGTRLDEGKEAVIEENEELEAVRTIDPAYKEQLIPTSSKNAYREISPPHQIDQEELTGVPTRVVNIDEDDPNFLENLIAQCVQQQEASTKRYNDFLGVDENNLEETDRADASDQEGGTLSDLDGSIEIINTTQQPKEIEEAAKGQVAPIKANEEDKPPICQTKSKSAKLTESPANPGSKRLKKKNRPDEMAATKYLCSDCNKKIATSYGLKRHRLTCKKAKELAEKERQEIEMRDLLAKAPKVGAKKVPSTSSFKIPPKFVSSSFQTDGRRCFGKVSDPQDEDEREMAARYHEGRQTSEDREAEATFVPTIPTLNFDNVKGMETLKKQIRLEIFGFKDNPKEFAKNMRPGGAGILMFGPPGGGKTLMANAIAGEARRERGGNEVVPNWKILSVTGAALSSKWCGQSSKLTKALFAVARKNTPIVVFLDEFDGIAGSRDDNTHAHEQQRLLELMVEMEKLNIEATTDGLEVLLIAATNRLSDLDVAVLDRFKQKLRVDKPTAKERLAIMKLMFEESELPLLDIDEDQWFTIGAISQALSCRDLRTAVREAGFNALRRKKREAASGKRSPRSEKIEPVSYEDIKWAVRKQVDEKRIFDEEARRDKTKLLRQEAPTTSSADKELMWKLIEAQKQTAETQKQMAAILSQLAQSLPRGNEMETNQGFNQDPSNEFPTNEGGPLLSDYFTDQREPQPVGLPRETFSQAMQNVQTTTSALSTLRQYVLPPPPGSNTLYGSFIGEMHRPVVKEVVQQQKCIPVADYVDLPSKSNSTASGSLNEESPKKTLVAETTSSSITLPTHTSSTTDLTTSSSTAERTTTQMEVTLPGDPKDLEPRTGKSKRRSEDANIPLTDLNSPASSGSLSPTKRKKDEVYTTEDEAPQNEVNEQPGTSKKQPKPPRRAILSSSPEDSTQSAQQTPELDTIKCELCDKVMGKSEWANMDQHKYWHHPKKPFKCSSGRLPTKAYDQLENRFIRTGTPYRNKLWLEKNGY